MARTARARPQRQEARQLSLSVDPGCLQGSACSQEPWFALAPHTVKWADPCPASQGHRAPFMVVLVTVINSTPVSECIKRVFFTSLGPHPNQAQS